MPTESIKTQGFQIPFITLILCALVPSWLNINYAKQSQFPKSQVFTKFYITRTYESWTLGHIGKTNPIQTQFKANSNPNKANQSQFKANQTQFQRRKNAALLND